MADEAITPIKVMNIGMEPARQPPRQFRRPLPLHRQMKVIGHHAIMIAPQTKVPLVSCQPNEKLAAIVVIANDPLTAVAVVHDAGRTLHRSTAACAGRARSLILPLGAFWSASLPAWPSDLY
jgi:hypothetical protein